jgi:hypothetical protein
MQNGCYDFARREFAVRPPLRSSGVKTRLAAVHAGQGKNHSLQQVSDDSSHSRQMIDSPCSWAICRAWSSFPLARTENSSCTAAELAQRMSRHQNLVSKFALQAP